MKRRSLLLAAPALLLPGRVAAQPLPADPFPLGVASGWPRADGISLWTRLMGTGPAELGGGPRTVRWILAEDDRLTRPIAGGSVVADPAFAHSVHVDVRGLSAGRPYWYRFDVEGRTSPVGRTRTAAAAGDSVRRVRLAFASCQQYEQGYYTAHRHLAAEELDAVLFVGDYIYEKSWGRDLVRRHEGGRTVSLADYRARYATYKSDPDLRAAHAAHPWIVTWDDHEVDDDYTDNFSPQERDPARFMAQRAAAYQAFFEHMPLPASLAPQGPALRLHSRHRFGNLVELHMLDDRQYRSPHACRESWGPGKTLGPACTERLDPRRTMLGTAQEAWLTEGLARASARWTAIGQQTLMAPLDRDSGKGEGATFWADGWDGYPAARQRLLGAVAASPVRDTLVLGGDVHSWWAADLAADPGRAGAPIVATEFVGTSISSQGPSNNRVQALLAAGRNPHLRYGHGGAHGYSTVAFERDRATVEFKSVSNVKKSEASVATLKSFAVERGRPGVQSA
ncbi:MAG: alkaline phosphatase [Alphaproteobacteria bacterium]|nr:alkaline phosphatase [Alphaproteobacteria bacterium]